MIVNKSSGGWRCITQSDHARLSHDLLSLWRAEALERHPRRAELLIAVREHDNGWQEADSAPRLNQREHRPHDFTTLPTEDRLDVWRRGIARHRDERPYVAALIIEHALYLHREAAPDGGEWSDFLLQLTVGRQELLAEIGLDQTELSADYRWLHWADLVSLALCSRWKDPFERWGLSGRIDGDTAHLDPFPLTGATAFTVPYRHLEPATFTSDAAMSTALATCRWEQLTVRIAR